MNTVQQKLRKLNIKIKIYIIIKILKYLIFNEVGVLNMNMIEKKLNRLQLLYNV